MDNDYTIHDSGGTQPPVAVYPIGNEGFEVLERLYKWSNIFFIVSVVNLALGTILQIAMIIIMNGTGLPQFEQSPMASASSMLLSAPFYIIPLIFIHRFKSNLNKSLENRNSLDLPLAFEFVKKYFKFQFILMAIAIGFLIFFGFLAIIALITMKGTA